MSTFSGLSVALTSLQAQRRAMDVASQNVANVNTPGYTRQRAELQSIDAGNTSNLWGNPALTGDGVQVATVTRITDEVTQARLRGLEADGGYLATAAATMGGMEKDLGEPSKTGLTEQLATWYADWANVANHPEDSATVNVVVEQAQTVVDTITSGLRNVEQRWDGLRDRVDNVTSDINASLDSVAALNKEIYRADIAGAPANELKDKRDQLLTKLAGQAGIEIGQSSADPSMVKISIGGVALVDGQQVTGTLKVAGPAALPSPAISPVGVTLAVQPTGGGAPVQLSDGSVAGSKGAINGSLGADLDSLNKGLPDVAAGYDAVAAQLRNVMNTNSNAGFFTGTSAKDLAIDTSKTLVTSTPGTLDGNVADAIIASRAAQNSPAKTWTDLVGRVGVQTQSLNTRAQATESNRSAAEATLTSATGVDIDEEMTNLVMTQRAYQAAGRMMSTLNEVLDTLLNLGR